MAHRRRAEDSMSTLSGSTAREGTSLPFTGNNPRLRQFNTEDATHGSSLESSIDGAEGLRLATSAVVDTPRIMLGLDYGTTHTGLAFMTESMDQHAHFTKLELYDEWHSSGGKPEKVPSVKSYSKTSAGQDQWGADVDLQNSVILQWTKLELPDQDSPTRQLDTVKDLLRGLGLIKELHRRGQTGAPLNPPIHITKTSETIVKDFLYEVARSYFLYTRGKIDFAIGHGNVPLDITVTHPVDWSYPALNKTFRAVTSAFSTKLFKTRRNIYFVSEPEACAVFTLQDMIAAGENPLVPGECFLICDAGGGTVDLATYCLESEDPFEISQVGKKSGGRCGATFIDQAFIRWMKPKITNFAIAPENFGSGGHFVLEPKGIVLLSKFERMKRQFSGKETNTLQLPKLVKVDPSWSQYSEELRMATITPEDMKGFFEFSIKSTIDLIERQVAYAETHHSVGKVSHIFMSGGMSINEYVMSRVQEWAMHHGKGLRVRRPRDAWTAVARGAVLCGMGIGTNNAMLVLPSPRHYGICGSEIISSASRPPQDRITPFTDSTHGKRLVMDRVSWLIKKGDVILQNRPAEGSMNVIFAFLEGHLSNGSTGRLLFVSDERDAQPSLNLGDVNRDGLVAIHFLLSDTPVPARRVMGAPNGSQYIEVTVQVAIRAYQDNRLEVALICHGKSLVVYKNQW
ncbi:hypothetical protein QBC43DRAFT_244237 [Cladorrhinum sp. PSN259]|nr:hypothetical protein QBC43DRAFT_244237 [Cladorrhinum sp. PSN259]